jgi:hypothetical protein
MSKRRTKKKKNLLPLIALATIGGVLLITAAVLLGRKDLGTGGGTPILAVDQKVIDFGDVKFNVQKTFTIRVTNTGDGTLRFKEAPYIQVLEGC